MVTFLFRNLNRKPLESWPSLTRGQTASWIGVNCADPLYFFLPFHPLYPLSYFLIYLLAPCCTPFAIEFL